MTTPITPTSVQHAQQDPQKTGLPEAPKSAQPSKGKQSDHPIFHGKRPSWANPAKGTQPQSAGMEDHAMEAIPLPQHAAELLHPEEVQQHAELLHPEDQKSYRRSLDILQSIHAECGKRALTPVECTKAFEHLGVLQALNAKCLQSLPQFSAPLPVQNTVEVR